MEKFYQAIAQILSYAFHPGIMPTFGTLLILWAVPDTYAWATVVKITLIVFMGTYVGPFLGIVILRLSGIISSVYLINREERIYPYLIGAACMIATGNHLEKSGVPIEIIWSVYLSAFVVIISTILLPFFKSSAHASAAFALYALYLGLHQRYGIGEVPFLLLGGVLAGAICWGRTTLDRHTLKELLSGALLGFLPMYLLMSK